MAKRERPRKLTPVEQKQVKRSANKGDAIGTAAGLAATAAFPGVRRAAAGSARLSRALYQGGKAGTSGGRLALGGARPSVKSRLKTVGSNAKLAGSSAAKGVGAGGMYMLEKHPKQALGAYGALVVGSQGGAQIGHTKKRREILRKSEDGMDFGLGQVRQGEISKAYDPERKRKRRLDVYQAGATAAAPGLAGGAVFAGRGPAKQVKTLVRARHPKGYGSGQRPTVLPLGPKAYRAGLKHVATSRQTGITAALGLGAVGAAVGADRIKRYKRGNGRSYRPLHAQI